MHHRTTRIWTVILAVVLALTLLLTACTKSGTTPTGDNSTPSMTETPGASDPTPDDTTEPDDTPSEPDPTTSDKTYDKPVVFLPDPEDINEKYLEQNIHRGLTINALGGIAVVDNMIDEAYEIYGKYLDENISKLCLKVGLYAIRSLSDDTTAITPEALKKVNDFLIANGEEPLGTTDPKQRIAALWLAASLYYDPGYNDNDDMQAWLEKYPGHRFDIANAFALAKYSDMDDVASYEDSYAGSYAGLFNIP